MRETERVRILERMREKVRERVRERERRMMEHLNYPLPTVEEKMVFVTLNPLLLTIFRLVHSNRVSMDPRSRAFLILAAHGVNEALHILTSLEKLSDRIGRNKIDALEWEIREAAGELEYVLDSHVSILFHSQSETESRIPLLYSLNLDRIEHDIDAFIEKVIKMERRLQEEVDDGDGKESDIFGLCDQYEVDVTRILFSSWLAEEDGGGGGGEESDISDTSQLYLTRSSFITRFATKAASIFSGIKDDYIQELENLLPQDHGDYAVLFTIDTTTDFFRTFLKNPFWKINGDLMIWWIHKAAAASTFVMERNYTQRRLKPLPESESRVKMVGSTHLLHRIRHRILLDFDKFCRLIIITGMAGIGKTALAKKILKDRFIRSKFECCIFLRLGPECKWEEVLRAILAQMPGGEKMLMEEEEDVDLVDSIHKTLMERKCLIVLDDYWKRDDQIQFFMYVLPSSPSVILVTTRSVQTAKTARVFSKASVYQVPFLNKEESWDLLQGKIFGEKRCLPQLEKAGRKIAENCEGLPLLILAVAHLLSQAEKTPEYWCQVVATKKNSIFVDAYEQLSDVTYPSYYYLDEKLKACFLYLGAFPQNDEVRVSRLISLWSADGFLGVPYTILQKDAYKLLKDIVSNSVALGTQWSGGNNDKVKVLSLHSVFWYLCRREARNEKFLHALNSYTDASVEGIRSQTRLSIYNNTILAIKDARDSIASISTARSLICTGPYNQYQVPMCWGLRLLRVLDALTIRFYEFPVEVLKLVQLRYLGITCNGNLPPSISNLWGLQCFIFHHHLNIKSSSVSQSYLPVEIWDLQELEHLHIMGRNLPEPPPGTVLRKLLILLDVGAHTCTQGVLESTPNLVKLRVQIELMPVGVEPLRCCDDISHLQKLESLQFVIVNPELTVAPTPSFSFFSTFIRKLTLSGFGYPWEDMHKVAELSNLRELKLKFYAFQGEKWQAKEGEFKRLTYLSIEDTDLVQWTGNFQSLAYLTIKNCYRLLEIPKLCFINIRVVDCHPSAVTCTKRMKTNFIDYSVCVECSWLVDGKRS